jgi:hypothetical protein
MRTLTALFVAGTLSAVASATAGAQKFTVKSPDISQGKTIPMTHVFNGMGCTGGDLSPALSWSGAPAKTKSFAITIYDPDAPTGSGFWHWVMYNVPATTMSLPEGAGDSKRNLLPAGTTQGITDFGAPGYGGPCPPVGDKPHHYHIKVTALDIDKLDLPPNATPAYVGFNLHGHTLGVAELVGLYGR